MRHAWTRQHGGGATLATDKGDACILKSISKTLGVDVAVFQGDHAEEQGAQDNYHSAVLLSQLFRAFNSLPDDHKRLEVLQFVEELAARES
jgi:DNA-directed RNA polymerase specialized sigma24 family protein